MPKMRYFEERRGRVEIIPMIDVMMFLLVFFIIVTLQMIPDAGLALNLPDSTQSDHLPHPEFTVNIATDGSITVKGKPMSIDELVTMLSTDGDPAKTQVTIAADKEVAFQFFVHVMDAARKAGVSDVGVATQSGGGDMPTADASSAAAARVGAPVAPASAPAASGAKP
jgi:biopolymer transport protein ExbD